MEAVKHVSSSPRLLSHPIIVKVLGKQGAWSCLWIVRYVAKPRALPRRHLLMALWEPTPDQPLVPGGRVARTLPKEYSYRRRGTPETLIGPCPVSRHSRLPFHRPVPVPVPGSTQSGRDARSVNPDTAKPSPPIPDWTVQPGLPGEAREGIMDQ